MPISLNTVISQLDTPSSLLPFFVKDACDVTGRTVMANNEGGKHEAREKFIEEAGTSLFWIAGIPLFKKIADAIAKKKLDTDIHFKRINSHGIQSYYADELIEESKNKTKGADTNSASKKAFTQEDLKGINLKSSKLEAIKKELFNKGFKVNEGKGLYKKYHVGVSTGAVIFNLVMLMFALPQFNQFLSRKLIAKEVESMKNKQSNQPADTLNFEKNNPKTELSKTTETKQPSFTSLKDFIDLKNLFNFTQMAENAQLKPTSSMLLLDYGISGSRVTVVPRDNNERIEYAVKEGGIILFFYYAADIIKHQLAKFANKVMKTPIDLDYKVLQSKDFAQALKTPHDKEKLLAFAKEFTADDFGHLDPDFDEKELKHLKSKNNEISVIKFIDEELAQASSETDKEKVFKNFTLQMAQKEGLIDIEKDGNTWIRHSKKYIETDKVLELNSNLKNFYNKAFRQVNDASAGKTLENILAKTKKVKIASVITNIGICCASLSYFLPKIQYAIREHRTNTTSAPGIKLYQEMAEKNMLN